MALLLGSKEIFNQLKSLLVLMDEDDYNTKIKVLSYSTVGQHVRHVIEFFQCFMLGYNVGVIDYDDRSRNVLIEESKHLAIQILDEIVASLNLLDQKRKLQLKVQYNSDGGVIQIDTTVGRELAYNMEHAIHHMAIIKIGLKAFVPSIVLPSNFGVAYSTLQYQQKQCVQ